SLRCARPGARKRHGSGGIGRLDRKIQGSRNDGAADQDSVGTERQAGVFQTRESFARSADRARQNSVCDRRDAVDSLEVGIVMVSQLRRWQTVDGEAERARTIDEIEMESAHA